MFEDYCIHSIYWAIICNVSCPVNSLIYLPDKRHYMYAKLRN